MGFRCVQCGFAIETLYVQYSPGNIRLMKCENCKAVADEYIECELMILLIDLILHKPKAYRHLLYNVLNSEAVNIQGLLWKLTVGFILLDAYRSLLLRVGQEEWDLSTGFSSVVSTCEKILVDVFFGNFIFFSTFYLATKVLLNESHRVSRYSYQFLAILISSYFKIFLVFMMVWEFPLSVIFVIDLFVLSSNTVAMEVITGATTSRCFAACFFAHSLNFFGTHFAELKSLTESTILSHPEHILY